MGTFIPDYNNIIDAARNIKPQRMPIYEHIISPNIMEEAIGKKFTDLYHGNKNDRREFFKNYNNFFLEMGYDTVSFECCIGPAMPGSGSLGEHKPGVIKTRDDFNKYPWKEIPKLYFEKYSEDFQLMGEELPAGMKAIGGPGNGLFECVQDITGYMDLCYISVDDPKLYNDLFVAVGNVMYEIWEEFLKRFSDFYCVLRFGDDLGFKTSTLIKPEDIKSKVIPRYKRVIELVHSYGKPFLLHCCGNIFSVMEDLIDVAKIDAKHSNEDQIATFDVWIEKYGKRIGNFGGVDMNVLCQLTETEIKEYVKNVISYSIDADGFALGSGNSIPDYIPLEGYMAMVETARDFRGDYK
jgi:uroporphyrinogen decarboxylase